MRRHPRVAGLLAMPIVATARRGVADRAAGRGERRDHLLRPEVPAGRGGRAVRRGWRCRCVHLLDRRVPQSRGRVRGGLASAIVALGAHPGLRPHRHRAGPVGIGAEAPRDHEREQGGPVDRAAARGRRPGLRIADLDAPLPAFWIDFAGDRKVSPILSGQWFLAFTDTWTLDANAMASITTLRGPGEVPLVAERILLRRPDAVVIVRREDVAAVRRAVGSIWRRGVRPVTAVPTLGATAGAVTGSRRRPRRGGGRPRGGGAVARPGGTPVGVADNGDGARLYCGAGLTPAHPEARSNWQGGVVLDFTHGRPGLPGPDRVRRAAGAAARDGRLRPDLVAHPPRGAVRAGRRRAHRAGGVGGGPGHPAARARPRVGAAGRSDVHAVLPLDVQRARGPARRRTRCASARRPSRSPDRSEVRARVVGLVLVAAGGLARGDGQGVVRPAARGGARRRGGDRGGATAAGWASASAGALALVALAPVAAGVQWQQRHFAGSTRTTSSTRRCCPTSARPRLGRSALPPAALIGRGPRLLPERRRRAAGGRGGRGRPGRPPGAPRTGCCSRTRRPRWARSGAGSPRPSARTCPTCRRPR